MPSAAVTLPSPVVAPVCPLSVVTNLVSVSFLSSGSLKPFSFTESSAPITGGVDSPPVLFATLVISTTS